MIEKSPKYEPDRQLGLRAPEGARCSAHPDRPARYLCPRCGSRACATCWHDEFSLCEACLRREAIKEHPLPPPFENRSLPGLARIASTLGAAFRPQQTALSFSRARVVLAGRFALLTILPLSALAGIIPHTQTLLFSPGLKVDLVGRAETADIALDVARAMLVQCLFDGTTLLALGLPFISLTRSYARQGGTDPALAVILYRSWLMPAASIISYLALWIFPSTEVGTAVTMVLSTLSLILLVFAMWSTTRQVSGIGSGLSLVVLGVSWMVAVVVSMVVGPALAGWFGLSQPGAFGLEGQNV